MAKFFDHRTRIETIVCADCQNRGHSPLRWSRRGRPLRCSGDPYTGFLLHNGPARTDCRSRDFFFEFTMCRCIPAIYGHWGGVL